MRERGPRSFEQSFDPLGGAPLNLGDLPQIKTVQRNSLCSCGALQGPAQKDCKAAAVSGVARHAARYQIVINQLGCQKERLTATGLENYGNASRVRAKYLKV